MRGVLGEICSFRGLRSSAGKEEPFWPSSKKMVGWGAKEALIVRLSVAVLSETAVAAKRGRERGEELGVEDSCNNEQTQKTEEIMLAHQFS